VGLYYRIQPTGLEISTHYSADGATENTGELSDGLHVFQMAHQTFYTDGEREWYGDEVVVIEAAEDWDTGDVEGVCVDPEEAKIIARYSWSEWLKMWKKVVSANLDDNEINLVLGDYHLSDFDDEIEHMIVVAK
jgi:hypothetical protein